MDLPPGNRFKAAVSPNRKYADINDRKQVGSLTMLDLGEVQELHSGVARLMQNYKEPFAVKLPARSSRHVLTDINDEDGWELLELLHTLEGMMVPASS